MKKTLLSTLVLAGVLASAQVGINTEDPEATLTVKSKTDEVKNLELEDALGTKILTVLSNGNVGIGKENPAQKLDIEGKLRIGTADKVKTTDAVLLRDAASGEVKEITIADLKTLLGTGSSSGAPDSGGSENQNDGIVAQDKMDYIKKTYPDEAESIINKIKVCTGENIIVFDKKFGEGDGSHDFVYCAVPVRILNNNGEYRRTWLNTNLGAEYAKVGSPDFNPVVASTLKTDYKAYGSLFQFGRDADGHELMSWSNSENGSPVNPDMNWYLFYSDELAYTKEKDPCPAGYHIPTKEEWIAFHQAITGNSSYINSNKMWIQTQLPNFTVAGKRGDYFSPLSSAGSEGNYWSSIPGDSYSAYSMYFSSSISFPNDNSGNYRSHGFSVRCLKD